MYRALTIIVLLSTLLIGCSGGQVCSPTPEEPAGIGANRALFWREFPEGQVLSYTNVAGSKFEFQLENPARLSMTVTAAFGPKRTETQGRDLKDRTLTPVFLATNIGGGVLRTNGPVYFYRCGTVVEVSDAYAGMELK